MLNLLALFITPFITSLIAFLVPCKRLSFLMSLIPLAILLTGNWTDAVVETPFRLEADPISLLFLYLTAIVVPISILTANSFGLILLVQAFLIAFFLVRDLLLFVFFYEAMLIPLYFILTLWGARQAALKFILYMVAGSILMIAGVVGLYVTEGVNSPWLCAAFLLAFAVKTPLFPFHAWLPDSYCQAPTSGTILLAGLLSKAGIYGIVRVSFSFFPATMQAWDPVLIGFAIAGVFYGALAAWRQNDFKRLIAYSSLSHVNFILIGLFTWNEPAALLQAFNHGITITALFLVASWLEERLGNTSMAIGGLAKSMPRLCWLTLFFILSLVALPGTNNFVGELLILYGLFKESHILAALLGTSVILSVLYALRFMQTVYFGEPTIERKDIRWKEIVIALPLIALILWLGLYPTPLLKALEVYP